MNKKKNILMISYPYPPIKAVGSLRSYFLSKNLERNKWNVYVFSTTNSRFLETDTNFQKLTLNRNKINLPTFDLQTIKAFILKCSKKKDISIGSQTLKTIHSLPFNISHMGGFLFILAGFVRGLWYIKRHKIDYIYSTYNPYSDHIVAFLLKVFNKRLTWVADFRDLPFGDNYQEIFLPNLQRRFNRLIFGRGDYIITVSEGLKEKLKKYNSNIEVIRNGIPVDSYHSEDLNRGERRTKTFNIVYTGTLYYGRSEASLLFKTLKKLSDSKEIKMDFKLIYAGKQGYLWSRWAEENGLSDNIELLGLLDRDKVLDLQRMASINLVLTWSDKNQNGIITGKFYEYLAANKPILCIINGQKDKEIENLSNSVNSGLVVYNQPEMDEHLEFFIKRLYREWNKKRLVSWEYNRDFLETLKYENLTKKLEDIFFKRYISQG